MPVADIKKVKIAKRYAKALLELENPENTLKELREVSGVFEKHPELTEFFIHPVVSVENKVDVIKELFKDKTSVNMTNFLCLLAEERRADMFASILECLEDEIRALHKIVQAEVKSVVELDCDLKERLKRALETKLDMEIEMKYTLEPSLIGGFVVRIQDKVMDLSVKSKLAQFEKKLKQ